MNHKENDTSNNSSIVVCKLSDVGTYDWGDTHANHRENMLTTAELMEVVFPLQSNPGSNTSSTSLRVVGGGEKGTQCLGV
jgi:hypothetical protein